MAITDIKEKIEPYVKSATGYIKYLLSSDHVVMDNGKTLQEEVNALNSNLTSILSYDINSTSIIGYRNSKPVYRVISRFSANDYNLSLNGAIQLKIPEIVGKQIITYSARMIASYGCYLLPYIRQGNNATWIYTVYNTAEWNVQYNNTGESWTNWVLEIEILYQ